MVVLRALIKFIGLYIFLVICISGCANFYKPVIQDTNTPDEVEVSIQTIPSNKYFILHVSDGVNSLNKSDRIYSMTNIIVDNSNMTLTSTLMNVDPTHFQYINAKRMNYRYDNEEVLNEVHIYAKDDPSASLGRSYVLPFSQIEVIELIEHDKKRTTRQNWGAVGITLGVAIVATVIIAAVSDINYFSNRTSTTPNSSCPYVYTFEGNEEILQGELFGGAVNRPLERKDYLPLKKVQIKEDIRLLIRNELQERQFINTADLMVIEHEKGVQANVSTDGRIYQVISPVVPASASLNDHRDVLNEVIKSDGMTCSFDDSVGNHPGNELVFNFENPGTTHKAKLVLQVKNSYWLELLYEDYVSRYGNRYEDWQDKQNNRTREDMTQWMREQLIPLSVSMLSSTGWKEITTLNPIGPLMSRQVIIPIDVQAFSPKPITIKLSCGFMFWDIDYAALDFAMDGPVKTTTLKPYSALDENGRDILPKLLSDDDQYLTQLEAGNYAILKYIFGNPISPSKSYSLIVLGKGYYEPVRKYDNKPDREFLKKFRKPGELAAFSKRKYLSIMNTKIILSQDVKTEQ